MPSIKISEALLNAALSTTTNKANGVLFSTSSSVNALSAIGGAGTARLQIYSGTRPVSAALFTNQNTNVLLTISLPNAGNSFQYVGRVNDQLRWRLAIQGIAAAASATGTATWFALVKSTSTDPNNGSVVLGNVGGTGSGADLEIGNTSIVSGQTYNSSGFFLNFPLVYTF